MIGRRLWLAVSSTVLMTAALSKFAVAFFHQARIVSDSSPILLRRMIMSGSGHGHGFGSKNEQQFPSIDAVAKKITTVESVGKQVQLQALMNNVKAGNNVIDQTVEFPTESFQIKVIGLNEPNFAFDMINIIASVINQRPEEIKSETKVTSGGKYMSLSLKPRFNSADDVYKTYAAVQTDKRVKFVM